MISISEDDLLKLTDYILLDVRTPEEYEEAHLHNAKNIPVDELIGLKTIPFLKDKTIICYCRSGLRSQKATDFLIELGYKAFNLGGYLTFSETFIADMQQK
ncbi:MAG: rhodanese-like domain-containing protein [Brevinema sp.]